MSVVKKEKKENNGRGAPHSNVMTYNRTGAYEHQWRSLSPFSSSSFCVLHDFLITHKSAIKKWRKLVTFPRSLVLIGLKYLLEMDAFFLRRCGGGGGGGARNKK